MNAATIVITDDKLLTVAEAAKRICVSRSTLYSLCNRGKLSFVMVGETARRIPLQSLEAFIEISTVGGGN